MPSQSSYEKIKLSLGLVNRPFIDLLFAKTWAKNIVLAFYGLTLKSSPQAWVRVGKGMSKVWVSGATF